MWSRIPGITRKNDELSEFTARKQLLIQQLDKSRGNEHVIDDDSGDDEGDQVPEETKDSGPDAKHVDEVPYTAAFFTYFSYVVLILVGYVRDMFGRLFKRSQYSPQYGYGPLLVGFKDFYTRRLYYRIQDCWGRPISSTPGAWVDVVDREWERDGKALRIADSKRHCLNLGSYNYLGYGEVEGGVTPCVLDSMFSYGSHVGSAPPESASSALLRELESSVADFVGKPSAIVSGMGFATNAALIPSLVGPGCLIVSDALNHASIVIGARSSGAKIRVFEHNSAASLDSVLRDAILDGQPHSGEPWRKILVIVEGIYSMEGDVCALPEIIAVKKKYGAYLYLDEAHSIGALGASGRGACEYHGVSSRDVDIMMGTFTKSFGAVGGYIAADTDVVDRIRWTAAGSVHGSPMSPVCIRQVLWVIDQLTGRDGSTAGQQRMTALRENAIYIRQGLSRMGLRLFGDYDSPVIPIMLYHPAKIAAFSRECLKRQLAVVVVGFPATPLILSRARLCVSAAHTREDLDMALEIIDEVAELLLLRYAAPVSPSPNVSQTENLENLRTSELLVDSETVESTKSHRRRASCLGEEHRICNGVCYVRRRNSKVSISEITGA